MTAKSQRGDAFGARFDSPAQATRCARASADAVAYTIGTDFRPAARRPVEEVTFIDTWGTTP